MDPLAAIFSLAGEQVFALAGVFARIGAIVALLPGLGERGIPMRLRLGATLALTVLVAPLVRPLAGPPPPDPSALAMILAAEAVAGLTIGLGLRLLVHALQIAGMTAAYHLSISHIFATSVSQEAEPTFATFLSLGGIVLAMMAGLHLHVVGSMAGLYEALPFGRFPAGSDLAELSVSRLAQVFAFGISLAFPFIAISFVYNLALGALSRAMPQLLVALIGAPLLIGLGLVTLWLSLPMLYERWGEAVRGILIDPLGPFG